MNHMPGHSVEVPDLVDCPEDRGVALGGKVLHDGGEARA